MVPRWSLILLLAAAFLVPSGSAQLLPTEYGLFMTTGEHENGGEVLAFQQGTEAGSHTFSPVAGGLVDQVGPTSYSWTTQIPFGVDVVIQGDVTATIYFGTGIDAAGTTTVTLRSVADGTALPIATDSATGTAQAAAHAETFSLATAGQVLPAGSFLRLDVEVGGLEPDVLLNLQYGDDATPSGIASIIFSIRDRDGDGFGDTAELAAQTNPDDPMSYPGAPPKDDLDNDGLLDAWEDDALGSRNWTADDDPDEDGCHNACEYAAGTDPLDPDSDDDDRLDGLEIQEGTDPLTADAPRVVAPEQADASPEAWRATAFFFASTGVAGLALMRRFT